LIGISTVDDVQKFRTNSWWTTSIRNPFSRTNLSFPDSSEIDDNIRPANAEGLMNWIFRGISIDWSDEL
jgi:lysophospholipid acyltransferase (LPLAT)-like uncharacterized protein